MGGGKSHTGEDNDIIATVAAAAATICKGSLEFVFVGEVIGSD